MTNTLLKSVVPSAAVSRAGKSARWLTRHPLLLALAASAAITSFAAAQGCPAGPSSIRSQQEFETWCTRVVRGRVVNRGAGVFQCYCPQRSTASASPATVEPAISPTESVRFEQQNATLHVEVRTPDGRSSIGGAREPVTSGTQVATGEGSAFSARIASNVQIRMGGHTEITFEELLRDPERNTLQRARLSLVRGLLQWVSDHGGDWDGTGERFRIRTPNAVCAVRGTDVEFFFDVDVGGYIKLRSGEVALWPIDSEEEVILRPGQMVRFDRDYVMTGPMPID